jgi:nucleoside-diphosphate-sugar epimerase/lipopolysaccharide/colanic/teichoic acid biosynthesis glycosyltransferase
MQFLLTGATGFIGKAVRESLLAKGLPVIAAARKLPVQVAAHHSSIQWHSVGAINGQTQWQTSLKDVEIVVHCAACTHVIQDQAAVALDAYREVNVAGTLNLANQSVAAGVKRFIFISSIKVNGETTSNSSPFSELDLPAPEGPYAQSKAEAEKMLLALAEQTGMEVVIIRPPLVYGPGVKGNFFGIVRAMQRGLPLPLGAVHNKRSLVALENLVSLILLVADRAKSPLAANQVFVVADGEDVSTTTLLRKVSHAAGFPSILLPVPICVLRVGAILWGKHTVADRLLCNLQVDPIKARTLLGWRPVVTMDQQLASMFSTPSAAPDEVSFASNSRPLLRVIDVFLAATGMLVLCPVLLLVCAMCWFDTRSPVFAQERVGRNQRPFVLIKFRTMRPGTESVASHLASSASITRMGAFLRRTKLDELPQLWNVLCGHMSLVGPRPGLLSQYELTAARAALGVFAARPGITGLAQVNKIDMSTPKLLAQTDADMLRELGVINYFKFILLTVAGKGSGDRVKTK